MEVIEAWGGSCIVLAAQDFESGGKDASTTRLDPRCGVEIALHDNDRKTARYADCEATTGR